MARRGARRFNGVQARLAQDESRFNADIFLSQRSKREFPNQAGFSSSNIRYTVRGYKFYNQRDKILQQVVEEFEMPVEFGKIPWGNHILIFSRSKSVKEAFLLIGVSMGVEGTAKQHRFGNR